MKKNAQPPAYREGGQVFHADSCVPLVGAVAAGKIRFAAMARGTYPGERLPASDLPGLLSAGYWDALDPQDWGLPPHRNEGIELSFLATGEMAVRVEGQPLRLRHDELLITRPWQPHQLGDPHIGPGRLLWVILDVGVRRPHQSWQWPAWIILNPADLAELTGCLRGNEQPIWPGADDLRRPFQRVAEAVDRGQTSLLALMVNELLLALLGLFRGREVPLREAFTSSERTVRLFLEDLPSALTDPWTVDSMAESCGLGVTRFVEYCERITNKPPALYLRHLRLHRARELLARAPEVSITDIALESGFSSSQHFATTFRKELGMTPGAYRKTRAS